MTAKRERKEGQGPKGPGAFPVGRDSGGLIEGLRGFILDLDGTIYLDEEWIPGARQFLQRVEESGRRYCFLTNNSSKSAAAYLEKLARMGLAVDPARQLVTSGGATADWLLRNHPGKRVYLFANPALRTEFAQCGVLLDDRQPELVVTAFDTSFDYAKLCRLCSLVRSGLPYIATHPDYNCPTRTGFVPDIGALHAYVQASTGRLPDLVIGKPNRQIMEYALRVMGTQKGETAMVGDRLYTDIRAGAENGLVSILVLSGEAKLADLPGAGVRPDLIFDSVAGITPLL